MPYQFVQSQCLDEGNVKLFARNDKYERAEFIVQGIKPHFYKPLSERVPDCDEVVSVDPVSYRGIYGDRIEMVTTKNPIDVEELRGVFSKTWEADIRYVRRVLIDLQIKGAFEVFKNRTVIDKDDITSAVFSIDPLICYFDIECYSSSRVPKPEAPNEKVTCMCFYDTKNNHYISLLLSWNDKDELMKLEPSWTLMICSTEEKLMLAFKRYLDKELPDILAEWGNLDAGYLAPRGKRFKIFFPFKKMQIFNMIAGYKNLYKKTSNRLKDVAFDEKIVDYIEKEVNYAKMYDEDPMGLVARNKHHVEVLVELDKKKHGLVRHFWNLMQMVGLESIGLTRFKGLLIDTELLRRYLGKYALPTKKGITGNEKSYEGALIVQPPFGKFDDCAVYDMSRYYPNIIISKNLTPEFDRKAGTLGEVPLECLDLMKKREVFERELAQTKIDTYEYYAVKSKRDAVKFILNTVYGYFGSETSRFYPESKWIAEETTETGRNGMHYMIDTSEKLGSKVLYTHTDSIIVRATPERRGVLERDLNDALKDFCKAQNLSRDLTLKCDRYCSSILFTGVKGRYAARVCWEDGKDCDYLYVVGFDYIRQDASLVTKDVQRDIFDRMLRQDGSGIQEFIREVIKKVKSGAYNIRQIAIAKTPSMPFDQYKVKLDFIRGIKYANKYLNAGILEGDQVKIVFIKKMPPNYPRTDVISFLEPECIPAGTEIDYDVIIDKTIRAKVEDFLKIAKCTWEDVVMPLSYKRGVKEIWA